MENHLSLVCFIRLVNLRFTQQRFLQMFCLEKGNLWSQSPPTDRSSNQIECSELNNRKCSKSPRTKASINCERVHQRENLFFEFQREDNLCLVTSMDEILGLNNYLRHCMQQSLKMMCHNQTRMSDYQWELGSLALRCSVGTDHVWTERKRYELAKKRYNILKVI